MKQEKDMQDKKTVKNIKRVAIGATVGVVATGAGLLIEKEIRQEEKPSDVLVHLNGNQAKVTGAAVNRADTQDPTLNVSYQAIKGALNSFTSSSLSGQGIVSPNDLTSQKLINYLQNNGYANDISKFNLTLVASGATTTANVTTVVGNDAATGFGRYNLATKAGDSYASNETLNGGSALTFSKSNNQKTLDSATISINPGTNITNNYYSQASATTIGNYSLSGISGASITTISIVNPSQATSDSQGNTSPYDVAMNFSIKLGTATRQISKNISYTKINKQTAIDALMADVNSLSITGDKYTTKISSTNNQFGIHAAAVSSFANVQYSVNGTNWVNLFNNSSDSAQVQSQVSSGITLPNGTIMNATNIYFKITQVGSKPSNFVYVLPSQRTVSTSSLTAILDIKAILDEIAAGTAITVAGNSKGATVTTKTYTNIKIEVKVNGSSQWQSPSVATSALASYNFWDNNGAAWQGLQFDYKITSTNGANIYSSSETSNTISGSTGRTGQSNFATSSLNKFIDTTTISGNASGNTNITFVLPTISTLPNTSIEFEVFNGTTSQVKGDKATVETWVRSHNLWNSTTNSWNSTAIKARIKANTNYSISSNQEISVWTSSANSLPKYVVTQDKTITVSGESNSLIFTQPSNTPSATGFDFEYQIVGVPTFTGWKTKSQIESWISSNNLWDQSAGTKGNWRATSIQVRQTAASGFVLDQDRTKTIWTTSSNTVKFVDASSLISTINSQLKVSGDDQHLVWNTSAVVALATKLNLTIEVALSSSATAPSTGYVAISSLPTTWPQTGVLGANKHIWVKVSPIDATFNISAPSKVGFDIASSSGIQNLGVYYTVSTTDLDGVVLQAGSTSKNLLFAEPLKNEFSYEFSSDGGTSWVTLAQLNTTLSGMSSEGIWDSSNQSWRISNIKVRPVAKSGYVLSAQANKTIWTSANPGSVSKWIDSTGVISQLQSTLVLGSTSTHTALDWGSASSLIQSLNDRGIKIEFLSTLTAQTNNGQSASGWTTTLPTTASEDKTKRFIYVRISSNESTNVLTTSSGNSTDITSTSKVQTVSTYVDVDSLVIDSNLIRGDSHNLNGATTFSVASSSLSTYQKQGVSLVFTLSNWNNDVTLPGKLGVTGPIPATMTESQLKAFLNGNAGNLYSISQDNWVTSIKAKLVSSNGFVLSSSREVTFDFDRASLTKWVDTANLMTQLTTGTSTKILAQNTSTNDHVIWQHATVATLGYSPAISQMEFLVGNYSTLTQANAAATNLWTTTLSTTVDYTHANRNIWVRFKNNSGFTLSNSGPIDLTTTSQIQNVKSKVDTLADYTAIDLSKIAFTGTTKTASINEALAGNIPTGSAIEYRVWVDTTIGSTKTSAPSVWMSKTTFLTYLSNTPKTLIRQIEVHLASSDSNKYVVVNDKKTKPNISSFYSFVDVASEISVLTTTQIKVLGVLGQPNAIEVIIPAALRQNSLVLKGLVLQYSINDAPFTNFIAKTTDQAVDNSLGFEAALAGSYDIMTITDKGPSSSLKFRVIPVISDEKLPTNITDLNDWQSIVNDVKVKTSDIETNGQPTILNWNVATLPKLVQTRKDILMALSISGNTKNLVIDGLTTAEIGVELDKINTVKDYNQHIEAGFQLSDGNISSNLFFKRDDFITWLSGTATATMKVFNASTNKMEVIPTADLHPHWNAIDLNSIKARWISTNDGFRVSDPSTVPLSSHTGQNYNVQKWTDLTQYITSLEKLVISGDTSHLTSTSLSAIIARLENDFGKNSFVIETTNKVVNSIPDFTTKSENVLPSSINFLYELGFRIVPEATHHELIASTLTKPLVSNPSVIWDKNSSTTINKFIVIDNSLLESIALTGDTRNWTIDIPQGVLKSTIDGQMDTNGTYEGLEVYARVNGVSTLQAWRTISQLKTDAAAANISIFDGTWGRESIELQYRTKTGYAAEASKLAEVKKPNVSTVNRFIDITSIIDLAQTKLIVSSKNKTEGWWNESSSNYDDLKSWSGYVDNQDFDLSDVTIPTSLKVEIEYSLDNITWQKTKPSSLNDVASNRSLYVRFVKTTDYTAGESAVLSDSTSKNITASSGIRNILTYVNISTVDLTKIEFIGDTRRFTEDLTKAGIPLNTHVEYSITDFLSQKSSDVAKAASASALLAKIGIKPTGSTLALFNSYNASMTWNELQTFVQALSPLVGSTNSVYEILRNSISARVVAENGYSIKQPEDIAKRLKIDVTKLYTLKDITEATNLLHLSSNAGVQDGINLYGQKATVDGILVQIPDALVAFLNANGLKLQFTTDGQINGQSTTISSSPTWHNTQLKNFPSASVPGSPAVNNGFLTKLDAFNGKYSFIGFRIVPTTNDEGVVSTAQEGDSLSAHYDATMTKLFTSTGTFPHKQYIAQENFYSVDTSKVPTVIRVDKIDLAQIKALGDTRFADIIDAAKAHAEIDKENQSDLTLDDNLQLLFTIDLKNGDFINGDGNNINALWLTEVDFEAYLKGDLIVQNGKVINKNNPSQIVEAFDTSIISARNLKNGDAVTPNYLAINTVDSNNKNSLFVKWSSISSDYVVNPDFIPSQIEPKPVTYTSKEFKKWFDGNRFNTLIPNLVVNGDTNTYSIDYTGAPELSASELDKHSLKMQYSFDGIVWQDSILDFTNQTYAIQTARQIHMRVVPKAYSGSTAIVNFVEVDGIKIDYQFATLSKADALANTTKVINGQRNFRTYLDITNTELSALTIAGNSFELEASTLDETAVDNNTNKYTAVEVQYLYDGIWYNKAALLAKMLQIRNSINSADAAAAFIVPTDFINANVKARWHVLDTNNFVLKDQQTHTATGANQNEVVSQEVKIDASAFKTFINVWNLQDRTTNDFRTSLGSQDTLLSLQSVSGTTFTLDASIIDIAKLPQSYFTDRGLKIQYSVVAKPSKELNSTDWKDAAGYPKFISTEPFAVTTNPPLWFRVVPIDSTKTVVSTANLNGLGSEITPITIDTSNITYQITTNSAALEALVVSGDTQDLLSVSEGPFTVPFDEKNGAYGVSGLEEYVTDATGVKIATPTKVQTEDWLRMMGLRLNYKVTATRTKGSYVAGKEYEFNTFADLKAALQTTNLNFTRDSLMVRWDFANAKFTPSDEKWAHPNTSSTLVNVVYTEDIFSLTSTSLKVSGNNLALQPPKATDEFDKFLPGSIKASDVLDNVKLHALGIKLQYNWTNSNGQPDASTWKDAYPDGKGGNSLNGNKDYWIRYAPIDANFKLASNKWTTDVSQVTRLNVEDIKLAIPFTQTKVSDVLTVLNAAAVVGKTYDFQWETQKGLPVFSASADNIKHGHIQYSRNNIRWEDTIAGALSDTDYYGNGVLQFDKDRGDKLFVRYVYEETIGNVTPADSSKWVFTDAEGTEISLGQLTREISIDSLIQPVMTTSTLSKLTGQNSVIVPGLINPIGGTDFAQIAWSQLANYGLFKPNFVAGINDQVADFRHMWYDGQIGSQNPYIFNMGQNPFKTNEAEQKDILNALLPRHTHLEYRWSAGSASSWSSWSKTTPTNIIKNSNYDGFEVRLVADAGFSLSEVDINQHSVGFTIPSSFMDGSSRTAMQVASQEWTKRYPVVVELLTRDVQLPALAQDQAQFIGWTDGPNGLKPTGTFFTDGAGGNHHPSNDANALKNIVVKFLNQNGIPLDFLNNDRGYVIEWNVQSSGRDIEWTDSRGLSQIGWHASVAGNMNIAPGSTIPWYGTYPTGLKNGDVIQARLRARDGFVISNDDQSTDYNASTKSSRWSHTMTFAAITSLTQRIVLPTHFALYDSAHPTDFDGASLSINQQMPSIHFSGNEQSGKFTIQGGPVNPHFHYEAAVLHPILSPMFGGKVVDDQQKPLAGYALETVEWQQQTSNSGKATRIYELSTGWVSGWKGILDRNAAWQPIADINELSVGDVIVTRLVADDGYGFEWEDKVVSFEDINYPKPRTYDAFGTIMSSSVESSMKLIGNEGVAPIPVRGLTVRPRYDLSELALVYSLQPEFNLNNGLSKILLNYFPGQLDDKGNPINSNDKYRWEIVITKADSGISSAPSPYTSSSLDGLKNGDIIEIKAIPLNGSFILDPTFINQPIRLTIHGLAEPLIADGISRPIMTIEGYDGAGTITSIAANGGTPTQWSQPDSQYPFGRPMLASETQPDKLIWQYQIVDQDPTLMSATQLATIPWTNEIPKNLKYNDFVRMRVGTVDASQVALQGGKNWVYSINPSPLASDLTGSWYRVENLNIESEKLDYTLEIAGYILKTRVSSSTIIDTDETSHVDTEMRVIHADGTTSAWVNASDGNKPGGALTVMVNGDKVEMRVIAKSGYRFNKDQDANSGKPEAIVGTHITTETRTNQGQTSTVYILQKDKWVSEVKDLRIYINTEAVTIMLDASHIINMENRPLAPNGKPLDGNAQIKPAIIGGTQTIKDVNNQTIDPTSGLKYEDLVKIRYIVRSIDSFTGQQLPEQILPDGQFPKELNNGDIVTVELYSTNPQYQISNPQRVSITVSGLVTVVDEDVTDPFLTFSGESGKGSVSITPQAPRKTKWIYAVTAEPQLGQTLPIISEDTNPTTGHPIDPDPTWILAHHDTYYWTSTPPTNLVNGDYVIAMLVSSIPGSGGLKVNNVTQGRPSDATPMNTRWIQVQGLAQKIDLSKYQFELIDRNNPWTPEVNNGYGKPDDPSTQVDESKEFSIINYAFKLVGHQEGQASLEINSPIDSTDTSIVLVDRNGKPLPASIALVVQWAFAVNNDASPTGNYNWSTTLPKALFNGQYVHAKLVAKVGTTNIDVYGYRPQVFKVTGLDAQASISNKVVTLVAAILGGIAGLGAAVGTLMFLRKRKKKLHFSDKF